MLKVSEQKRMSAIAIFLQQLVIHAVYRHTEKEGYEIFVGTFLTNLLRDILSHFLLILLAHSFVFLNLIFKHTCKDMQHSLSLQAFIRI